MHNIKFVAQHTGLSPHVIRAWERRYGALEPERSATNRRQYSSNDLRKLKLLSAAVGAGHSIGQIANLSVEELEKLPGLEPEGADAGASSPVLTEAAPKSEEVVRQTMEECLRAAERLDPVALQDALARASAVLGTSQLTERVMIPLLHAVGDAWRAGGLRPAQEHLASAVIRSVLGRALESYHVSPYAPRIVVTTPIGQEHELGALIAALTAASEGWMPLYLGPDLPADEIAGAVHNASARAVALSIVYPPDDPRLPGEMDALRRALPSDVTILVGGRAALVMQDMLEAAGAVLVTDMTVFRRQLESLRTSADRRPGLAAGAR